MGPTHERPTFRENTTPDRKCEGNIRQVDSRMALEMIGEIPAGGFKRRACTRREQEQDCRTRTRRSELGRSLFKDYVSVCPADTKGADRGTSGHAFGRRWPVAQLGVHIEGTDDIVDFRVRLVKMQAGRDLAVVEAEHSLD